MNTERRGFLLKVGMALNAVAAALLAMPIIGYLGGALRGRASQQAWITLGALDDFPIGQTRTSSRGWDRIDRRNSPRRHGDTENSHEE